MELQDRPLGRCVPGGRRWGCLRRQRRLLPLCDTLNLQLNTGHYAIIHYNTFDYKGGNMSKATSVRLDEELASKLDALAISMDRPKAWLIEQAIRSYVEEQAWQVQAIREAMEDYRSGKAELVPHEQVMERLEAK